jgi:MarR family transcriptional regulator, organic hydroperoxide resistance regulator
MGNLYKEIKQTKPFVHIEDEVFINLQRTADALMRKLSEVLKTFDLTPSQYNVLRILRGSCDEGLICREIGERMVSYDPDVTKLLDRLEARGLITRERQTKDRRVVVTCISEEGLKLLKKVDPQIETLIKELLEHLGARKLKTLNDLLEVAREKVT